MKTILLFLIVICLSNKIQANVYESNDSYVPSTQNVVVMNDSCKWLVDDAKWFYAPHSPTGQHEVLRIEVVEDTLIEDRVCAILGVYLQNEFLSGSELTVFYEVENEKVYFFEEEEFKLLFDFSPSFLVGDTISHYVPSNLEYYDISNSSGSFIPTEEPLSIRNEGHEWIDLLNGEQLRVVNTELVEYSGDNCFVMGKVIDGIGSLRGLMGQHCLQLAIDFDGFFRCFQSATLNYTAIAEGCLLSSIDEIAESEIKVYPNPTTGELNIATERAFSWTKIFDVTGKLLLNRRFTNKIDLGAFASGIYLVELYGNDGVYRQRLVKE